jgi:transposase
LQQGAGLVWETLTHSVERADVIAFFDRLATQVTGKTIGVLDNAPIHRGQVMRDQQAKWERKGLWLWYLPPYSPALNAIEIVWKDAKYFWRRFLALSGRALQHAVDALLRGFGSEHTITFQ